MGEIEYRDKECEGCATAKDCYKKGVMGLKGWAYTYHEFPDECPCKDCLIKTMCYTMCNKFSINVVRCQQIEKERESYECNEK